MYVWHIPIILVLLFDIILLSDTINDLSSSCMYSSWIIFRINHFHKSCLNFLEDSVRSQDLSTQCACWPWNVLADRSSQESGDIFLLGFSRRTGSIENMCIIVRRDLLGSFTRSEAEDSHWPSGGWWWKNEKCSCWKARGSQDGWSLKAWSFSAESLMWVHAKTKEYVRRLKKLETSIWKE